MLIDLRRVAMAACSLFMFGCGATHIVSTGKGTADQDALVQSWRAKFKSGTLPDQSFPAYYAFTCTERAAVKNEYSLYQYEPHFVLVDGILLISDSSKDTDSHYEYVADGGSLLGYDTVIGKREAVPSRAVRQSGNSLLIEGLRSPRADADASIQYPQLAAVSYAKCDQE